MQANALAFALISLAGSLVYVAVVVTLHVLPTGYDLVHNAVSDYGVGRYAPLFRVGLWAGSVAVLALAIGLGLGVGSPPLVIRDVVLLGLGLGQALLLSGDPGVGKSALLDTASELATAAGVQVLRAVGAQFEDVSIRRRPGAWRRRWAFSVTSVTGWVRCLFMARTPKPADPCRAAEFPKLPSEP
jgi:hypothetical protein